MRLLWVGALRVLGSMLTGNELNDELVAVMPNTGRSTARLGVEECCMEPKGPRHHPEIAPTQRNALIEESMEVRLK